MLKLISLYTIFAIVGVINGDIVEFGACDDIDESICKVKEVNVVPCTEAKSKKPCKFKSGTNATIEFVYVPEFDSEKMLTQAYSVTPFIDLPLIGMDREGCKFTECPVKKGVESKYKNSIFMSPAFPLLNYNVKWRLWDANNGSKGCCFTFKIKIVR